MPTSNFSLSPDDRLELKRRALSGAVRADQARCARMLLMLDQNCSYLTIQRTLGCDDHYITRWAKRYREEGLEGLRSRRAGRQAKVLVPELEARVLAATQNRPPDGSTHWSTRKLAAHLHLNHMLVARVWARSNLKPHRMQRYMASTDPDFETKAADVIGLYVNPPQHAAIFCVDEKTAIQALDRRDPVLPLSPGRLERHGFEYSRHGTLSLYAALNTRTGEVLGQTAARHTSQQFVAFLEQIVASQPKRKEIHVIADNLSAHKTKLVAEFLQKHPGVQLHYTPTYSSWLNQVELWFAKIERDVIARGIFTSVKDLARKLMRYIRHSNKTAKPIKWLYRDTSRRITGASSGTGH